MSATTETSPNLDVLLEVPVKLSVELGSRMLSMKEVLNLTVGSVVQLDKMADAPVDLYVNQKLVAKGQVVVVEDRFGVKIIQIVGKMSTEATR